MLIVLLMVIACCGAYCKGYYSYAEDINYMSDEELEAAYQAYLQSKGGGLIGNAGARLAYTNGKMLNFLTSSSNTTPYRNINEIKGLMSWQKAELESGNSSVLQLSMSQGGASVFSLYTQWLLQNHYFGNGVDETDGIFDDGVDNLVYSGEYFIDDDGNSCLVTIINVNPSSYPYGYNNENIIAKGSTFVRPGGKDVIDYYTSNGSTYFSFNVNSNTYYYNIWYASYLSKYSSNSDVNNNKLFYYANYTFMNTEYYGRPTILKMSGNRYGYGILSQTSNGDYNGGAVLGAFTPSTFNSQNTDINFYTTNNNNISVYPTIDADGTLYITPKVNVGVDGEINYQPYTFNQGDTITNIVNNYYTDSGTPDKTISIPDDEPYAEPTPPYGGTQPDWGTGDFGGFEDEDGNNWNFNFNIPDLNIDWEIQGLKEKFPFSIPFDLIAFVQVLDAEPETPEFTGTINLIIYQWEIDADLSAFDNLASIVRNVEFIGFCITLIMITRKMIKG